MTTTVQTQSDYRDLPLDWLVVSPTNPRKTFDEDAMQELAASIRENGVLQPLLVRPRAERRFEIVFGERRYRGAAMAEKETVPVCIREMTDAQVLEAQLVENLQRQDVHPLREARGFSRNTKSGSLTACFDSRLYLGHALPKHCWPQRIQHSRLKPRLLRNLRIRIAQLADLEYSWEPLPGARSETDRTVQCSVSLGFAPWPWRDICWIDSRFDIARDPP